MTVSTRMQQAPWSLMGHVDIRS